MSLPDDALLTLKDACEIFFAGRITVATLKAEHSRGNLDISKIGRAYFTTPAKLREMEAKCRVEVPARGSGLIKNAKVGQLWMAESVAAQASVQMKLQERKRLLGITSRRNTR